MRDEEEKEEDDDDDDEEEGKNSGAFPEIALAVFRLWNNGGRSASVLGDWRLARPCPLSHLLICYSDASAKKKRKYDDGRA